jgi:hypothetical protein
MTCPYCGAEMPTSALFCGECGRLLTERRTSPTPAIPAAPAVSGASSPLHPTAHDATEALALPEIAVSAAAAVPPVESQTDVEPPAISTRQALDSDDEQTVLGSNNDHAQRFSLQFSTGESVAVFGTGLIGRNPRAEPREYFDHLVIISDPGKSVSKTHLEFGTEDGEFWVSDRVSGNGTSVLVPGTAVRRCEPAKRYFVARGGKVVIGDQFFIVS